MALRREVTGNRRDRELLALERMRMIDAAHSWAKSTSEKTARGLRQIGSFCNDHGLPDPFGLSLPQPPQSFGLSTMWAMEKYTLLDSLKPFAGVPNRVTFNSARSLRSAASAFYAWRLSLMNPNSAHCNRKRQVLYADGVSPTLGGHDN